ncbi:protein PAT1 homolog 1-like [Rhopilema esculentum]|uniref:protein PAT1 homolog 1-like n=1 Tax=Rhopilema esculentum TaxID=499914 RepID=UPI0031D59D89
MSDTFFGFDTSLPAFETAELEDGIGIVNKNVDEKNDETFGADAIVPSPIRDSNDGNDSSKRRVGGMSIKEILTQEYKKSKEKVSLEEELEEEEIIENSISQLGLDDDVDDKESNSNVQFDDSNAGWVIPPQGTPERASLETSNLIQEMLSPDRRSIWSSPDRSSDQNSPLRNSKQPELLKQLFSSASQKNVPENRPDGKNSHSVEAIKAEELEKDLTNEKVNYQGPSTPVIIERRMPRTPAPPPGFPFPLGTPPSGIPWMTPPGVLPVPPMMLPGQMQQMLAASPYMAMLRGMSPMQGMPMGKQHFPRFMDNSANRGRYNRDQRPRRMEPGSGMRYQPRYQRRYEHSPSSYEHQDDDVVKLPASELMTSREKKWLVKIQLMILISDDVENKDYYYVNYMNKKAAEMETEIDNEEKLKKETEKDNFNKLLDIVEQKKEERKYRPAVFEGSLGKLSVSTVYHPRQIVDVQSKETDDEDNTKSRTSEGMKRRFNIYGSIEKAYGIVLDIEDIDRRLLDVPDIESNELVPERALKVEVLFNTLKLSLDDWQKGSVNDLFLQLMCIPKGKRLFFRSLKYFNKEQEDSAILSVISNLQLLTKKDSHDKILLPLINIVSGKLPSIKESFLSKVVTALLANNLSQLFLFSFGINFVSSLFEHVKQLFVTEQSSISADVKSQCQHLRDEVSTAVDQIAPKSLERHSAEIDRLTASLQMTSVIPQPHGVEE